MGVLFDNPITSVQMDLRGGWKNIFVVGGVYALIIFSLMGLWAGLDIRHITSAARGWIAAALGLQMVLVVLFSIVRVSGAVRQDQTSGIMESHRLMPITGLVACVGYIVGPTASLLALAIVNLLAGLIASVAGGIDPARFVMANLILLTFCAYGCVWGVTMGFYRRALFNVVAVVLALSFFSGGLVLYALPGLLLVFTPFAGNTVFAVTGPTDLFQPSRIAGFAAQAVVGTIALRAATRKFRRPDQAAFPVIPAMILLSAWVAMNLFGILAWSTVVPVMFQYDRQNDQRLQVQFVATAITTILLCLLPISAAVREQRTSTGKRRIGRLSTLLLSSALLCTLLIVPGIAAHSLTEIRLAGVGVSMLCTLIGLAAIMILFRVTSRAIVGLVCVFLLFSWFVPLFVDVVYHSVLLDYSHANSTPWSIMAYGMIGTLLAPWDREVRTTPGLILQVAVAASLVMFAIAVDNRRRLALKNYFVTQQAAR